MALTTRQSQVLKAIIEEYVENAQPVASLHLVGQGTFNVSGATIRNIMADLVRKGYLQMPHVSSGRRPTSRAYRYYITELMIEGDVSVLDEVALKQKIWDENYELERLLKEAANALSETTNILSFGLVDDGYITYSGTSKLLDMPEFFEIDVTRSVLRLLDDYDLIKSILENTKSLNDLTILIGIEIGLANMESTALIFGTCKINNRECYLGIIGPSRIKYERIIPLIKRACTLFKEAGEKI